MKNARALLLTSLLIPALAQATTSWTLSYVSGASVMGEISAMTFRVTNTSNAGERLTRVALQLPTSTYDIEGGRAPPGWQIASVNKLERQVVFQANGTTCPRGLTEGQTVDITLLVIGAPERRDQNAETFTTNGGKSFASFACPTAVPDRNLATSPTFRRIGIGATISASPVSLPTGQTVTITLTVTNRSINNATISPTGAPAILNTLTGLPAAAGAFTLQTSPNPASLSLAQDATGVFQWTYLANQQGVFRFSTGATASNLSSLTVSTSDVATGSFPGTISIFPDRIVSGGTVQVTFSVRNNSASQVLNVTPTTPSVFGNVTATLVSGPVPTSVTSLPPGSATSFVYKYVITGGAGETFAFSGIGNCIRDGFPVSSDPVASDDGLIQTHTVTINPVAVQGASGAVTVSYTILNGGSQDIREIRLLDPDSHFAPASNPWNPPPTGWTAGSHSGSQRWWPISAAAQTNYIHFAPGDNTKTFQFSYSSIGAVPVNTSYTHRFSLVQADGTTIRVDGPISIFVLRTVAPATSFTAVATSGKVGLAWNNPQDHDGALILRSQTAVPNTLPQNGRRYDAGATVGNATVVYADLQSYASTYNDLSVVDGQTYYYKVFNHDPFHIYATGDVPTSSGLFVRPGAPPSGPAWCYSVGLLTTQQPYTDFGVAVYSSSNARNFTANNISADPTLDGTERWRPVPTTGVVQARPAVTPFVNRSSKYAVVGDQSGLTSAIDVATGQLLWTGNGGAPLGGLGTTIQAQAAVQATQYADPATDAGTAFRNRYPNQDLVFFGTRSSSPSTNRVWALKSSDGQQQWSYNPGNLDIISGGMVVDYANNRLWVGSRSNGGTQPSLRALDTLNPPPLAPAVTFNLGDIDTAVIRHNVLNEIEVVNNSGQAYGIDAKTMTVRWGPVSLGGAVSGMLIQTNTGFIASTATGVQRYTVAITTSGDGGTTGTVTPVWASPTAISGPSAARIDGSVSPYDVYVSDSTGKVHRIDYATGALEASFTLSSAGLGMPSIDPTTSPKRLFVGGQDGRICAINLPF